MVQYYRRDSARYALRPDGRVRQDAVAVVDGERFAEGREAEVFLRADGTVLKLLRDSAPAMRVEREATVLAALAEAGVAAPVLVDVVAIDGRPGLVMNRIAGDDLVTRLGRETQRVVTLSPMSPVRSC